MTCPRCHALQADLAAARDELAAWRAHEADATRLAGSLERLGRWQARFGLTASEALILLALIDRDGAPMTRDALIAVLEQRPGSDHGRDIQSNVVQAFVCRLRQKLAREALGRAVRTVYGIGYAVDAPSAATLRERVGA